MTAVAQMKESLDNVSQAMRLGLQIVFTSGFGRLGAKKFEKFVQHIVSKRTAEEAVAKALANVADATPRRFGWI